MILNDLDHQIIFGVMCLRGLSKVINITHLMLNIWNSHLLEQSAGKSLVQQNIEG